MIKIFKLVIFTLILTFSASVVFAQHCPFDGGMAVVIHLTDENGETFTDATNIKLVQKIRSKAKSLSKNLFFRRRKV